MEKWADLSKWQGLYDMAGLKRAGYTGVIIQASHGHSAEPDYVGNVLRARAAGLRVGHYHFDENTQGEAAVFISIVKRYWRLGDAYPVMDYETAPISSTRAVEFTAQVKTVFGGAGLYSNLSSIATGHFPAEMADRWLWIAYPSPTPPPVPLPWKRYALWQKSFTTNGANLDLDIGDMTGALSHPVVAPPTYLDVLKGGRLVTRIRYGSGRVAAFLRNQALHYLHDGDTLVRSHK